MASPVDRSELRSGACGMTVDDARQATEAAEQRRCDEAAYAGYVESRRTGRYLDPDTGWSADAHPHDAPPSQPLPAHIQGRARWQADRSEHVCMTLVCAVCGTPGTYYGRQDRMPDEPRCPSCEEPTRG